MHAEFSVLLLFAVATFVALVVRWLRIPYTVALVLTGLGLGAAQLIEAPRLTKDLVYGVFLPGLVFEAAFHLKYKRYADNKLAIHALVIPGVVLGILVTALLLTPAANALHLVERFSLGHGLVLGAVLAATDPIAVVAQFRQLRVPGRLAALIEGESLLNDGTGVVLFTLILSAVVSHAFRPASIVLDFARTVGVGALVGAAIATVISKVIQLIDDPTIEITLTTLAAYGSFLTAEQLHGSGVIATVVAGMVCGNYAASTGMSPASRIAVRTFWDYVAFALNSIVFLLIGLQVQIEALLDSWALILVSYAAVTLARAVVVVSVTALLRRSRERIPWSWAAVLTWGGMRGALSMVLVLGLAEHFPHRDLLITTTYGVVILSILVQGLTMAPMIKRLGIGSEREGTEDYEAKRARLSALRAAVVAFESLARAGELRSEIVQELQRECEFPLSGAEPSPRSNLPDVDHLVEQERGAARRQLHLEAENRGAADVLHPLINDLEVRLRELERDYDRRA